MNLQDFTLLALGQDIQLAHIAVNKFSFEKEFGKYLSVTAPGEAAPNIKQSYIKLKAENSAKEHKKTSSL